MDQPARQTIGDTVTEVGAGHEQLRRSLNRLLFHPEATVNSELVAEELDRLTRYGQTRFAAEEALLARQAYPGLPEHAEEHRRFKRRIAELCCAASAGLEPVPDLLRDFLAEWWSAHVMGADQAAARFVEKSGVR